MFTGIIFLYLLLFIGVFYLGIVYFHLYKCTFNFYILLFMSVFFNLYRCIYLPLYILLFVFFTCTFVYIYLYILLFLLLHLLYKLFDLGHGRLVFGHQVGHLSLELWYTSKRLVHLAQSLFMLTDVLLELTGKIDKKNAINKGILIFAEEIIILEWIY